MTTVQLTVISLSGHLLQTGIIISKLSRYFNILSYIINFISTFINRRIIISLYQLSIIYGYSRD